MASSTTDSGALPLEIWKALAGTAVSIPPLGSTVYYFPQGHAEQTSSPPELSSLPTPKQPYIRCTLVSTSFLAHPDTDEVFVRMALHPLASDSTTKPELPPPSPDEPGEVRMVSKVLRLNDMNRFAASRSLAESIYPPLDLTNRRQNLSIRDLQGKVWMFEHVLSGTPGRHYLIAKGGWRIFVDAKKLIAGNTIIFIKNRDGEIFVGIRRTNAPPWISYPTPTEGRVRPESQSKQVSPESVAEAIQLGELNRRFEVAYYPTAGSPEFVVEADIVEAAMKIDWRCGMLVQMPLWMKDSLRRWFDGVVSGVTDRGPGLWPRSPWRMLQVTWNNDGLKILKNMKNVNPWQVEDVTPSTSNHNSMQGARHYGEFGSSSNSVSRADHNLNNNHGNEKSIEASKEPSLTPQSAGSRPSSSQSQGNGGDSTGTSGNSIRLFGRIIVPSADKQAEEDPILPFNFI